MNLHLIFVFLFLIKFVFLTLHIFSTILVFCLSSCLIIIRYLFSFSLMCCIFHSAILRISSWLSRGFFFSFRACLWLFLNLYWNFIFGFVSFILLFRILEVFGLLRLFALIIYPRILSYISQIIGMIFLFPVIHYLESFLVLSTVSHFYLLYLQLLCICLWFD